jgi:tRNA dimethylallyltransferase
MSQQPPTVESVYDPSYSVPLFMKKSSYKNILPKILVICGQTATGKSDLAVKLAKKFKGEIISADSRQVYKELDLGTGKISKKEMGGIPHHLLDVISPKKIFTVAGWQKKAREKIDNILSQNKLPIICGGTGFYIDSITNSVVLPEVPPNYGLRKQLVKDGPLLLYKMLKKLDPKRAETIDPKNKVRLIRAIEIVKALGKVPEIRRRNIEYRIMNIGLKISDNELREKIDKRLDKRIKQGLIEEVKKLHRKGLTWKRMSELGLEYKYVSQFLQNKINKDEMIEKLKAEIWRYARRQATWFKRDKSIKWFDSNNTIKIESMVKKFLTK